MGGRGGSGGGVGGGSVNYENFVMDSPQTIRVPYSAYKREYAGVSTVKDSYDSKDKTIEIKAGPVTREIMSVTPSEVVKQFPSYMSKYEVAVAIHNQFSDLIRSGEPLDRRVESWQRKIYDMVKSEQSLLQRYGSIQGARAAKRK